MIRGEDRGLRMRHLFELHDIGMLIVPVVIGFFAHPRRIVTVGQPPIAKATAGVDLARHPDDVARFEGAGCATDLLIIGCVAWLPWCGPRHVAQRQFEFAIADANLGAFRRHLLDEREVPLVGREWAAAIALALARDEHFLSRAVDGPFRTSPALALVLMARAEIHVGIGGGIEGRLDGGLDGVAVGHQAIEAIGIRHVATHVLGVVRHAIGKHIFVQVEMQRLGLGCGNFGRRGKAILLHAIEDLVATTNRLHRVMHRRISRRRFGQACDQRRLGKRQLIEIFLEITVGGCAHAPRASA